LLRRASVIKGLVGTCYGCFLYSNGDVLNEQMLGAGTFAFGDTPESVLAACGSRTFVGGGII